MKRNEYEERISKIIISNPFLKSFANNQEILAPIETVASKEGWQNRKIVVPVNMPV